MKKYQLNNLGENWIIQENSKKEAIEEYYTDSKIKCREVK